MNGSVTVRREWGSRCAFSDPSERPEDHADCPGEWDDLALGEETVVCQCPCHQEESS